MNKKALIALFVLLIILAFGVGFLRWKSVKKAEMEKQAVLQQQKQTEEARKLEEEKRRNTNNKLSEEKKEFVVNVDPDVSHWQIKGENEAFTIKFPKEWYWLESSHSGNEGYSRIITNNPNFDIVKYADIGILSDIGPHSSLELSNNTEIVITHTGFPTSNAGTPQDAIDSIFEMAKENYPSVKCSISNNKTIPFTAYCSAIYDNSQWQQSYYVINDKISLTITARTTKDTLVKKEILDKIVKSIVLKSNI